MLDLTKNIASILALAKQAGEVILDIYQQSREYSVQTKADHSPLTQADLMADEVLRNGLQKIAPDFPYLSEEGSHLSWEKRQSWPYYWLIDPLDGTREFIQHSGEFTVNVALIADHKPIFGVIYVPVTGECYYAYSGSGAYKIAADGTKTLLQVRNWRTDETTLLVSKGARPEKINQHFEHLGKFTMIRMSSSWKFCKLAEGAADISPRLGDTSEWDTAAGQCILEEAGGAIVNLQGQPLRYNTKESFLNPHFIALGDAKALHARIPWQT